MDSNSGRRIRRVRRQSGDINSTVLVGAGAVGLAVLGYHGADYDVRQTKYSTREECQQDWNDESDCTQTGEHVFVGPRYYWDSHRNVPMIVDSNGTERVATSAHIGPSGGSFGRTEVVGHFARGGFGGMGRGFSSGRGG
jgi:hypothetical protein